MKSFIGVSLLAASTAMVAGCHGSESVTVAAVEIVHARVVESQQREVPVNIRATGVVHARETALVSAQVPGRIQQIAVREGDIVRAGQTLAVLDDAAQRAAVNQAQAGVKAAQSQQAAAQTDAGLAASTLGRYQQLQAEKSVSPQEMDEISRKAEAAAARLEAVRAQTDAAQAEESSARTMLGYTRLQAPFAGIVTARMADPGTMASPGVPLLQIDQAGALQMQVTVDQSEIGALHKGMKAQVAINGASTANFAGTIAEIVPVADPSTHSFLVKIDLPSSSQLHAGIYGTAEFANGVRNAILISRSAAVTRGSLDCVYVLDSQGTALLRYVTLGAPQGDLVEVLSGISAGERLVDAPSDRDLAGKRIEVQP
jgi:RND family efflux transporter MFP subunit